MKHFLISLVAGALLVSGGIHDAEAKRLGGGGSFGMSRNSAPVQRQATTPPKQVAPAPQQAAPTAAPQPAPQPSGMRRWLGPIAGIAAGLGIAALFSHLGMGGMSEGLGSIFTLLLLVVAGFFLFRMFFRRPQLQTASGYETPANPGTHAMSYQAVEPVASSAAETAPVPAGFDADGFLRQAKLNFVRLQAANDKGDMEDLKQFTTPELFAEVRLQYDERGKTQQQTDVVQLDATLVEVVTERGQHVASVRFFGLLREEPNAPPAPFDEIWHLVKPEDGSRGWSVAGIQQVN